MNLSRTLTLAVVVLLAAACSRNEKTETSAETAADRNGLDHYVVQEDNSSDGEVASKATRESLLVELNDALDQLAEADNLHEAFRIAEAIEDLGKSIAPELQERVPELDPLARIAGWRAVWTLGSLKNDGWDKGVNGLLEIVTGEGEIEHRVAAAEVLGAVASTRHEDALRKALKEEVFVPEVKVQLSVALWRSAKDTYATEVLTEMLGSENVSFRIRAALALGEINQLTQEAKPILQKLAEEPTLRGKTAKRALDFERAIKRFEAAIENRLPGQDKVERIDTRLLDTLEKMIKERYIYPDAVSGRKLLYAAASGMLDGLDPYTCLLLDNQLRDAGEIRRFAVPTLGLMIGSARIADNREVRLTRVLSVKPGSPADVAGLRPGDRIYRVLRGVTEKRVHELRKSSADLPDEKHPFQTLPLDEAISQFQGAVGTTLGLNIMRDGWLLSRWVHVMHTKPEFKAISHEMLPGDIGMVHFAELNSAAPARVESAYNELREAGAKALILDLRSCAGGSVEAAAQVAGMFLPAGTLVTYSEGRSAELAPLTKYVADNESPDTEMPLVVLMDGGTADAGEILAGALHEHERATTAGETTFGRAIKQELIPLRAEELKKDEREAALLLTVARYKGPKSELSYYDRGVEPDTELKPRLFEGWVYDEFDLMLEGDVLSAYIDRLIEETDRDELREIARYDARNPQAYPGFDEFYKSLNTVASIEQVRYLLRAELRRALVADGVKLNHVDLQEDEVFTGAVKEAARVAGIDLGEIPEYRTISKD